MGDVAGGLFWEGLGQARPPGRPSQEVPLREIARFSQEVLQGVPKGFPESPPRRSPGLLEGLPRSVDLAKNLGKPMENQCFCNWPHIALSAARFTPKTAKLAPKTAKLAPG